MRVCNSIRGKLMKVSSDRNNIYKKIHMNFINILKSDKTDDRLIEFYCISIFVFYNIYLFKEDIGGIQIKTLLFYGLTLAVFLLCFMLYRTRISFKLNNLFNKGLVIVGMANFIMIIIGMAQRNKIKEQYILNITYVILLCLISSSVKFYEYYIDIILLSGLAVYSGLLVHYLVYPNFMKPIELLVENRQIEASYIILISALAVLQYCGGKRKEHSIFYISVSCCGFFLLFINGHTLGAVLMVALFLVIPLTIHVSKGMLKRSITVVYMFFLVLSAFAFLVNYTNIIKKEITFDIMHGIYLEIITAIVGVLLFNYWNRIPDGKSEGEKKFVYVKKLFTILLLCWAAFIVFSMLAGNKLDTIQGHIGLSALNSFIHKLQTCYLSENGYFFDTIKHFGLLGFLFICVLWTIIFKLILLKKTDNNSSEIVRTISILFLVQLIFFSVNLVSTPIYILLLLFGLQGEREKIK